MCQNLIPNYIKRAGIVDAFHTTNQPIVGRQQKIQIRYDAKIYTAMKKANQQIESSIKTKQYAVMGYTSQFDYFHQLRVVNWCVGVKSKLSQQVFQLELLNWRW